MKKSLFSILCSVPLFVFSQTNTFPASGYVGIGTLSPVAPLEIIGGPAMSAGWNKSLALTANYPVISMKSLGKWGGIGYDSGTGMRFWINSSTDDLPYNGLVAMTLFNDGNIGIGTTAIDNDQGWNRVLQLNGTSHAKLLVTESSGVKLGLYSHSDGIAKVGTESSHNLTFTAGYWNDVMTLTTTGNVGIGTTTPVDKLAVNGNVRAKEIKVEVTGWPDYVFKDDYALMSLQDLDNYINKNKHLPNIPSAAIVEAEGLNLGDMNKMLLQKIEELTLHLIAKDKEIGILNKYIQRLDKIENETSQLKMLVNELLKTPTE